MSDLTPQQTEAVRRALRAARHDAPVPDEVAARLDDRLAALGAERASAAERSSVVEPSPVVEPVEATVVALHRRRWPALLAAAAAVTAIGLVGTQFVGLGGQNDAMTAESAGSAADSDDALPPVAGAETHSYDTPDGLRSDLGTTSTLVPALTGADLDRLSEEGYRRVRALPLLEGNSTLLDQRSQSPKELNRDTAPHLAKATGAGTCGADVPADLLDETALYRARHDGRRVVLVVLPGPEVTAYPCGGGEPTVVPLE